MLNSTVLDVAVGMVFIFLLLSLIASVVQEILASFMQMRAANLLKGLRSLFSGDTLWGRDIVDSIYNHGLVRGLFSDPKMDAPPTVGTVAGPSPQAGPVPGTGSAAVAGEVESAKREDTGTRPLDFLRIAMRWAIGIKQTRPVAGISNQLLLPSYIPSRTFALAVIDLLNKDKATGNDALKSIIASLAAHQVDGGTANRAGQAIYTLALDAANAENQLVAFQANLENWYNDAMERVSGWYKRYTQKALLVIGLIIAVSANVSTVRVAQTLWLSKDTRDAMTKAADEYVKAHPNPPATVSAGDGDTKAPADSPKQGDATGNATTTAGAGAAAGAGGGGQAAPPAGGAAGTKPGTGTQGGGVDQAAAAAKAAADKAAADKAAAEKASTPGDLEKKLKESADAFNAVTTQTLLPVGWKHTVGEYWNMLWAQGWDGAWKAFEWVFGWIITACAISLGAPFWFDMLNKIMVVRNAIKPNDPAKK